MVTVLRCTCEFNAQTSAVESLKLIEQSTKLVFAEGKLSLLDTGQI